MFFLSLGTVSFPLKGWAYVSLLFLMGKLSSPDSDRCRDLPMTTVYKRQSQEPNPAVPGFGGPRCPGWACPRTQEYARQGFSEVNDFKNESKTKGEREGEQRELPSLPCPSTERILILAHLWSTYYVLGTIRSIYTTLKQARLTPFYRQGNRHKKGKVIALKLHRY